MYNRILIANRGEIALRIIRACKELGIETVCIFSEADRGAAYLRFADDTFCVGGPKPADSYLKIDQIISAAEVGNVEAVHPGYGFLAENAHFNEVCRDCNIDFIGPTPEAMAKLGDKNQARALARAAKVAVVPGSEGLVEDEETAVRAARDIGFPVLIKATAGGGGKGMRIAANDLALKSAFQQARTEALAAFGNAGVYLEKYIEFPRHVEVQVLADHHGNVVHLWERDCTTQRRHQKLIEESPSISVPQDVREKMGAVAVAAGKAIHYVGAGTIEFIFDNKTKEFFFMEMNTRLQVEHPVTELVVGLDLVKEQILVAAGKPLSFKQSDIQQKGHSIELRICAEDPMTFTPSPGRIRRYRTPQGPFVRLDNCAYPGYEVPIYYDPMIAKLITWGKSREDCIRRLQRALAEYMLTGIKSNIVLHKNILVHPTFLDGSYTTQFIDQQLAGKKQKELFMFVDEHVFLIAAAIQAYQDAKTRDVSEYNLASSWRRYGRQKQLRM